MNTEIKLSVSELKTILPGLNKVIARKATLPILGCVRVERSPEGEVSLAVTDLDDHLQVRMTSPVRGTSGALIVPYEALCRAIKNASANEYVVLINGGKAGVTLRTFVGDNAIDQSLESYAISEWPLTPVVNDSGIEMDVPMRQALRQAFICASEDESRLILNSAYLDVSDPNAHYVVGTNGRVLFSANSFQLGLKESLLVPRRKFLGWAAFWDQPTCRLASEPGKEKGSAWVQFKTDHWTFITRQVEGQYPNWKQIVPGDTPKATIQLSPEAVTTLTEVLPKLPGKNDLNSPITLVLAQGQLQVQANGNTQVIPIAGATVTGPDLTVDLNRDYLLRALQFGLAELRIFNGATPIICQAQGKRLIIAPLGTPTTTPVSSPTETIKPNKPMNPSNTPETSTQETALKKVIDQIEKIKETLKTVVADFGDVLSTLKTAEKEKKVSEKEIESVRATLRSLQKVQI